MVATAINILHPAADPMSQRPGAGAGRTKPIILPLGLQAEPFPPEWLAARMGTPMTANKSSRHCLGVVMPVYNEQATVPVIVRKVLSRPEVGELILVDDGSADGTWSRLRELEATDERVRIFRCEANRGKGAALRLGFEHAESEILVVQDADLEYDPEDYAKLLAPITSGMAEVVYGSRYWGTGDRPRGRYWHTFGNQLLTRMSNLFTGLRLSDMETCYKMFHRSVLERIELRENRFGFEPEFTAKLARLKIPIVEVPVSYRGRGYGQGKKIGWRDGLSAIRCIIQYRFR